jgi:hypothetical protein
MPSTIRKEKKRKDKTRQDKTRKEGKRREKKRKEKEEEEDLHTMPSNADSENPCATTKKQGDHDSE